MSDEILVIAAVLMIPGLLGVRRSLRNAPHRGAATGLAIIATTIPAMVVVSIFGGRLVFPVFDIELTDPDTAKLATALYFGGQHATVLILVAVGRDDFSGAGRFYLLRALERPGPQEEP